MASSYLGGSWGAAGADRAKGSASDAHGRLRYPGFLGIGLNAWSKDFSVSRSLYILCAHTFDTRVNRVNRIVEVRPSPVVCRSRVRLDH